MENAAQDDDMTFFSDCSGVLLKVSKLPCDVGHALVIVEALCSETGMYVSLCIN